MADTVIQSEKIVLCEISRQSSEEKRTVSTVSFRLLSKKVVAQYSLNKCETYVNPK